MKTAVWYHCKISGDGVPDPDFAMDVVVEQVHALQESGLLSEMDEMHVGVNGGVGDLMAITQLINTSKPVHTYIHGPKSRTELPTQHRLQGWLPGHEGWAVMYHHTKGISHGNHPLFNAWRRRLEECTVRQWRRCVADLSAGAEAVGGHWLTPEQFPGMVGSPFFGGTFWWATVDYLKQLPPLPAATWENRYEAENWIGKRRPYPRIVNYIPGWP